MTINDIIKSACGTSQNGQPASAFTIINELVNLETGERKQIGNMSSAKAVINIQKKREFMQIDFIYNSHLDQDMNRIRLFVKQFDEYMNAYYADPSTAPVFMAVVVPICFEGRIYLQGTNPITCFKHCSSVTGNEIDTISLLFKIEDFSVHSDNDINVEKIKEEISNDIQTQNYINEKAAEEKAAQIEKLENDEQTRYEYYMSQVSDPRWDLFDDDDDNEAEEEEKNEEKN